MCNDDRALICIHRISYNAKIVAAPEDRIPRSVAILDAP